MINYTLDAASAAAGCTDADKADIITFAPRPDDILTARAAYREVLIGAAKRGTPLSCVLGDGDWYLTEDGRDAVCEMLQYASFIFASSDTLCSLFGFARPDAEDEEGAAEILRKIFDRFEPESAVLTDFSLSYDGERIVPFGG